MKKKPKGKSPDKSARTYHLLGIRNRPGHAPVGKTVDVKRQERRAKRHTALIALPLEKRQEKNRKRREKWLAGAGERWEKREARAEIARKKRQAI